MLSRTGKLDGPPKSRRLPQAGRLAGIDSGVMEGSRSSKQSFGLLVAGVGGVELAIMKEKRERIKRLGSREVFKRINVL